MSASIRPNAPLSLAVPPVTEERAALPATVRTPPERPPNTSAEPPTTMLPEFNALLKIALLKKRVEPTPESEDKVIVPVVAVNCRLSAAVLALLISPEIVKFVPETIARPEAPKVMGAEAL